MKKSKTKICKMPKCNKETFDDKKLFCGKHERDFIEFRNKTGMVAGTMFAAAIASFIGDKVVRRK